VTFAAAAVSMTTINPFELLGADDNDDPTQLLAAAAAAKQKAEAKKQAAAATAGPAKLPTKPVPPAQAGEFGFGRVVVGSGV
jgi:plasminogen activator inhibitor 1 RNA-binding protein